MKIYRLEIKLGLPNNSGWLMISSQESEYVTRYEYYKDKAKAEHRKAQIEQAAMTINILPSLVSVSIDELDVIE